MKNQPTAAATAQSEPTEAMTPMVKWALKYAKEQSGEKLVFRDEATAQSEPTEAMTPLVKWALKYANEQSGSLNERK